MKLCRFMTASGPAFGRIEGADVVEVDGPRGARLAEAKLLVPSQPSKIVCVGLNYASHAAEMHKPLPKEPLLFLKPPSALLAHGEPILLPPASQLVHHEAELAIVIGRPLSRASAGEARHAILGWTCANDVTARDIQRAEVQYTRAKGFDTFAPVGPWIETELDPRDLAVTARINGEVRQAGRTADLIFDPFTVLAFISQTMTLVLGDIVLTGTPPGVGSLASGDVVEVEIEGVGTLRNPVAAR